jgi:hypothetical protein
MTSWCHPVITARRIAEVRRKDRRAGWLSGLIGLYSNLRRKGRRIERGRRDRDRSIRRRLNSKEKRARRR